MAYDYITSTGIISVDTSTLKETVEAEWVSALNAPYLSLKSSSPQGVLIAAETLSRSYIAKNNAEMANLINPSYSYGVALDAICALLGVTRGADTNTTGNNITIGGDPDTPVTSGSRVKTTNGDVFEISADVIIGSNRTATANIVAVDSGDVALPTGDLTIVDAIVGWGSATVPSTATITIGTSELTDAQLKTSRNQRLFAQGIGSTGAIQAHLLAVNNVDSVNIIENVTGQIADAVNGITFTLPAAVWVCVAGDATDADIASALWAARGGMPMDLGASGQGTQVTATVTDKYSGVDYTVKFCRAVEMTTYVKLTVKQGTSTATSAAIQEAALSYAEGNISGEAGLTIGADVSAYEFAGAITTQYPGLFVVKAQVAVTAVGAAAPADTDYSDYVSMSPWEVAELALGNISVTING